MGTLDKRQKVIEYFREPDLISVFVELYDRQKMSCQDVSRYILQETKVLYTPQYIRNLVKLAGKMRERAEAYELLKTGNSLNKSPLIKRINDKPISLSKRFRIFSKSKFQCIFCGERNSVNICRINQDFEFGKNNDANLICACEKCRIEKGYFLTEDLNQDEVVKRLNIKTSDIKLPIQTIEKIQTEQIEKLETNTQETNQ